MYDWGRVNCHGHLNVGVVSQKPQSALMLNEESKSVYTRESNIEALRIIAMLLIVFFHLTIHGEVPMSSRGG